MARRRRASTISARSPPAHCRRGTRIWRARRGSASAIVLIAPPFAAEDLRVAEDFDRAHPALAAGDDALAALHAIAAACTAHGLVPLLDVVLDRVAAGGPMAAARPDLFRAPDPARALDPRSYPAAGDIAAARFDDAAEPLARWWAAQLASWHQAGMRGFRFDGLGGAPAHALRRTIALLREDAPDALLLGWTPGLTAEQVSALAGCGLDCVFSSLPWWDFRDEWFWSERERLARVARVIAPVEAPFGARIASDVSDSARRCAAARRVAQFAAGIRRRLADADGRRVRRPPPARTRAAPRPKPWMTATLDAATLDAATRRCRPRACRRHRRGECGPAVGSGFATAERAARRRRRPAARRWGGDRRHLRAAWRTRALDRPAPLALAPLLRPLRAQGAPPHLAPGEVPQSAAPSFAADHARSSAARTVGRRPRHRRRASRSRRSSPSVDGGRFAAKRLVGRDAERELPT